MNRVFKFSRRPAQVTGYFKHLRQVLFVFHKAAVIGDETVLRLFYNFLLLLFFNLKTLDEMTGNVTIVEQRPLISFVNELNYS